MSKITRILSVDLGNYNTKTSNKVLFESRFEEGNAEAFDGQDILEFNDKRYLMEKGIWDLDYDKANKDYMPCLLTAIAKSFPRLNNITGLGIVLGLPLNQLKNKDKIIEELEGNTFRFTFNNKEKTVEFVKVGVIGEGFSSIYTLTETERQESILLVDIGGRTINIVEYEDGNVQNTNTIPLGMYNFYEDVQKELLNRNPVSIENVRGLIEKKKINDEATITKLKQKFVGNLVNNLKTHNPEFKEIYFTGGGAMTLKKELQEAYAHANFLNDLLFSNVLGNKLLADTIWGE